MPQNLPIRLRVDLAAIRESIWGPALWTGIREGLQERLDDGDESALALLDQVEVLYLGGVLEEQESKAVLVLQGPAELTADLSTQLGSEPELRHGWETYSFNDLRAFSPSEGVLVVASDAQLRTVSVHPSKRTPLLLRPNTELPDTTLALVVEIDEATRGGMRSQTGDDGMVAQWLAPMIDELDSISFTAGLADGGLQLHGSLNFSGERGAQLTGALLGYLSNATRGEAEPGSGNRASAQLLLDELDIRIEGTVVQLDLSLDTVQLGKLMSARAADDDKPTPILPGSQL